MLLGFATPMGNADPVRVCFAVQRGTMEMKFFGKARVDTGHTDEVVGSDVPRVPSTEDLITSCDVSKHMLSYLEKLDHVSVDCRLSVAEEATLLQTLSQRTTNRGMPVALENRLSYVCATLGPGACDTRGLRQVFTRVFESPHPYGRSSVFCRVSFPGASSLCVAFDESTEMRRPTDFVRFYRDADSSEALSAAVSTGAVDAVWGAERYTGTVFKGNYPGARPNPFKDKRPDLIIPAASFVLFVHTGAASELDWGWKFYVTAEGVTRQGSDAAPPCFDVKTLDLPRATPVIEPVEPNTSGGGPAAMPAVSTSPDAEPLHSEPGAEEVKGDDGTVMVCVVDDTSCGGDGPCLEVRAPRRALAGDMLQFLDDITPTVLTAYDPKKLPWDRVLKYKRPDDASTNGSAVLSLLDAFFADTMLGEVKALGAFFLYELARGDVALKMLPSRYEWWSDWVLLLCWRHVFSDLGQVRCVKRSIACLFFAFAAADAHHPTRGCCCPSWCQSTRTGAAESRRLTSVYYHLS